MPRLLANRTDAARRSGFGIRAVSHATEARFDRDDADHFDRAGAPRIAAERRARARAHQTAADRLGEANMRDAG